MGEIWKTNSVKDKLNKCLSNVYPKKVASKPERWNKLIKWNISLWEIKEISEVKCLKLSVTSNVCSEGSLLSNKGIHTLFNKISHGVSFHLQYVPKGENSGNMKLLHLPESQFFVFLFV